MKNKYGLLLPTLIPLILLLVATTCHKVGKTIINVVVLDSLTMAPISDAYITVYYNDCNHPTVDSERDDARTDSEGKGLCEYDGDKYCFIYGTVGKSGYRLEQIHSTTFGSDKFQEGEENHITVKIAKK